MKRFMKLMSVVLVLGVVATASNLGANPEVSVEPMKNITIVDTAGWICDPIERLMGMCRSSQDFLQEN